MKDPRGFTLIELLMVILVVVVLATVGITQFVDFGTDARVAVTKDRLNQIKTAIVGDPRLVSGGVYTNPGYLGHCGEVPGDLSLLINMPGSGVCMTPYDPVSRQGWRGPYLSAATQEWHQDAWGGELKYDPGAREIRSCGANQSCGDGDDVFVNF